MLIRDISPDERPIERLIRRGPQSLSDAELLSIIFGGQTALRTAYEVLSQGLSRLDSSPKLDGLSPIRFARVKALFELARRIRFTDTPDPPDFEFEAVAPLLQAKYLDKVQEHAGVFCLDSRHRIIADRELFVGTIHSALVSPREFLLAALYAHTSAIVMYHNHPSGDPAPSPNDLSFTAKLKTAAESMDITLVDHLIVGRFRTASMHRLGHIS